MPFMKYINFSVIDIINQKKLSQFDHNVWKGRLVNAVMESFNNTIGQMTEMSQRKNSVCDCIFFAFFHDNVSVFFMLSFLHWSSFWLH